MIGEPGIIDHLKAKADRAALWASTMKNSYELTAKAELRLSRSLMEADLEGKSTAKLTILHVKAGMRLTLRRREWHKANAAALLASRQLAAYYQGVLA